MLRNYALYNPDNGRVLATASIDDEGHNIPAWPHYVETGDLEVRVGMKYQPDRKVFWEQVTRPEVIKKKFLKFFTKKEIVLTHSVQPYIVTGDKTYPPIEEKIDLSPPLIMEGGLSNGFVKRRQYVPASKT
jgi:hypothetical protein